MAEVNLDTTGTGTALVLAEALQSNDHALLTALTASVVWHEAFSCTLNLAHAVMADTHDAALRGLAGASRNYLPHIVRAHAERFDADGDRALLYATAYMNEAVLSTESGIREFRIYRDSDSAVIVYALSCVALFLLCFQASAREERSGATVSIEDVIAEHRARLLRAAAGN